MKYDVTMSSSVDSCSAYECGLRGEGGSLDSNGAVVSVLITWRQSHHNIGHNTRGFHASVTKEATSSGGSFTKSKIDPTYISCIIPGITVCIFISALKNKPH